MRKNRRLRFRSLQPLLRVLSILPCRALAKHSGTPVFLYAASVKMLQCIKRNFPKSFRPSEELVNVIFAKKHILAAIFVVLFCLAGTAFAAPAITVYNFSTQNQNGTYTCSFTAKPCQLIEKIVFNPMDGSKAKEFTPKTPPPQFKDTPCNVSFSHAYRDSPSGTPHIEVVGKSPSNTIRRQLAMPSVPAPGSTMSGIAVSSAVSVGTRGDDGSMHYLFELSAGPENLVSEYIFDPDNGEPVQSKPWSETVQFSATYSGEGLRREPSITAVGLDPLDNVRTGYVVEYDQDGLTAGGSTGCNAGIPRILGLFLACSFAILGNKR